MRICVLSVTMTGYADHNARIAVILTFEFQLPDTSWFFLIASRSSSLIGNLTEENCFSTGNPWLYSYASSEPSIMILNLGTLGTQKQVQRAIDVPLMLNREITRSPIDRL